MEGEEIIRGFDGCGFARLCRLASCEEQGGAVRVVMEPDGKENAFGTVHGGAIFALADHAFGIAANLGESRMVAVSASIQYLAPATGRLEAVARLVGEGAETSVYEVAVRDERRTVALFRGVAVRLDGAGRDGG